MIYDVLIVNPIMDGMNLVSKEGPAVNTSDGALVLSQGAGSFMELGRHAVHITDALDIEETALALEKAIDMPLDERKRRGEALKGIVESSRPLDWIEAQITDLQAVHSVGEPETPLTRGDL